MKKILYISAGVASGLILVLAIIPRIQSEMYFTAIYFSDEAVTFRNYWLIFCAVFPLFISALCIEVSLLLFAFKKRSNLNLSLILFQVICIGYLLYTLFSVIYSIVLETSAANLLAAMLQSSPYSHKAQLAIVLMGAFLLLLYINLVLKRMKRTFPTIIQQKPGNIK